MKKSKNYIKICAMCGEQFTAHDKRTLYCSHSCRTQAYNNRVEKGIHIGEIKKAFVETCKAQAKEKEKQKQQQQLKGMSYNKTKLDVHERLENTLLQFGGVIIAGLIDKAFNNKE